MSNLGTIALAYGLIWALIGGYVFFVSRRQAALHRQLDQLKVEVDEATQKLPREQ